jgi:hypothetical protein
LGRAAKRAAKAGSNKLAQAYDALADKLDECRPRRRCGSLACPKCARAFQKAKVAAQRVLVKKLAKAIFPSDQKYDRPVVVSNTWSLGFIPYKHKAIKLPDLLRRNRTHLPELLLDPGSDRAAKN